MRPSRIWCAPKDEKIVSTKFGKYNAYLMNVKVYKGQVYA